ncbi:MAG TPA: TMEM175 family protein [Puia sp.]
MARPEIPHPREQSLERINTFSDGIFAIIITIMVLDLKKPESATFHALGHLWPTWVSYIASYIFIAIVWVNHHFLLKNAIRATPMLIWANFGHMFVVSLIPFLTAWMAETRLEAVPVAIYALDFFFVNLSYLGLIRQTVSHFPHESAKARRLFRLRSIGTLLLALSAVGLAFWHPGLGFSIVCCCFLLYLRPEAPGV